MQVDTIPLLWLQPAPHLCALVGAVIIHDEVRLLPGCQSHFQMVEEFYEFATAAAILTSTDYFAVEDVEAREQSSGAMVLIIVRLTLRQAGAQRQNGSRTIEGLNLALFIHTQCQGSAQADSDTGQRHL